MLIAVVLLTAGTAMAMGRRGPGPGVDVVVTIPALPSVVVLQEEPYYHHNNYYYRYDNDRWYYSKSKRGPWADLPRDHYPRETRYKGKTWKHDRGRDDNYHDRGRDDDYRDGNRDNGDRDRGHDNRR